MSCNSALYCANTSKQPFVEGGTIPFGSIAAANDFCNLDISCLVRNCGCNCNSVLSLGVDGAGTLENMATVVKKV